jgi:hypothetical protein
MPIARGVSQSSSRAARRQAARRERTSRQVDRAVADATDLDLDLARREGMPGFATEHERDYTRAARRAYTAATERRDDATPAGGERWCLVCHHMHARTADCDLEELDEMRFGVRPLRAQPKKRDRDFRQILGAQPSPQPLHDPTSQPAPSYVAPPLGPDGNPARLDSYEVELLALGQTYDLCEACCNELGLDVTHAHDPAAAILSRPLTETERSQRICDHCAIRLSPPFTR